MLSNNQIDVFFRNLGRPEDAERYQRRALEIDEKVRKPDDPKIPHRLNNLATVLTMQGKVDEAKRLLARAWELKASVHDITSVRILFSRIATSMMEKEPYGVYLGQIKALFGLPELAYGANVSTTWDIGMVIRYIQPKIFQEESELLILLDSAINDQSKLPELDRFPVWKDQPAVPLDVSW